MKASFTLFLVGHLSARAPVPTEARLRVPPQVKGRRALEGEVSSLVIGPKGGDKFANAVGDNFIVVEGNKQANAGGGVKKLDYGNQNDNGMGQSLEQFDFADGWSEREYQAAFGVDQKDAPTGTGEPISVTETNNNTDAGSGLEQIDLSNGWTQEEYNKVFGKGGELPPNAETQIDKGGATMQVDRAYAFNENPDIGASLKSVDNTGNPEETMIDNAEVVQVASTAVANDEALIITNPENIPEVTCPQVMTRLVDVELQLDNLLALQKTVVRLEDSLSQANGRLDAQATMIKAMTARLLENPSSSQEMVADAEAPENIMGVNTNP